MCHQTAGLAASAIEKAGIPAASVSLLDEVTRKVDPPRVLSVDMPLGYPLGQRSDTQTQVLRALLELTAGEPGWRNFPGGAGVKADQSGLDC